MSRRSYKCVIRWTSKYLGPQSLKVTAEGTSIRRAIANALLAFFSDKSGRRTRRDAHTDIEVKAWRLKTPPAE